MKPHIRRRNGIWECRAKPHERKGYGYRPDEAWLDWLVINNYAAHHPV